MGSVDFQQLGKDSLVNKIRIKLSLKSIVLMVICDMCCVKKRQSGYSGVLSNACFIHLNKTNKISLVCRQCLENTDDEVFYLPLQTDEQIDNDQIHGKTKTVKSPDKYVRKIFQNYGVSDNYQICKQIQSLFEKQIHQSLGQLQDSIMAYRSILGEYKKTVNAEYKAILSKIDSSILERFKHIVIQMHQQSVHTLTSPGSNTKNGAMSRHFSQQKQELDTYVRAIKISAQNQWPKTSALIEAAQKSYEKFRNVFMIQQKELNKKSALLKKIIPKITVETQYSKLISKDSCLNQNTDKERQKNKSQSGDIAIDVQDTPITVISQDEQLVDTSEESDNENITYQQQYRKEMKVAAKSISQVSHRSQSEANKLQEDPIECIQLEEDFQNIECLHEQFKVTDKLGKIGAKNGGQSGLGEGPWLIESKHIEGELIQDHVEQLAVGVDHSMCKLTQEINSSINLDEGDDCIIDSSTSNADSKSSIKLAKSMTKHAQSKTSDFQVKKQAPSPPVVYQDYEVFQISVENYLRPLESLRLRLTTDFNIKKSLEKNKITFSTPLPPSSVHDYSPYLKLIRRLKISYTRKKHLTEILTILPKCCHLQSLTISEPLLATEDIIQFIITSLPKLTSLEFLCFNKLNENHIKLIPDHLPTLQELYYGPKCHNNIALKSEYRQFRQHRKEKRLTSVKNTSLIELIKKVPSLRNAWISETADMQKLLFWVETKQNFEHLILGRYFTDSSTMELSQQSWSILKKVTNLQSLALLNIRIDTSVLETVLKNNAPTLQSLEIYACANWTDDLASQLKKCRSLKEFYLFNSDESIFKGHSLWDAVTLETLVLRSCQFMDFKAAENKISKLSQLKHIDVYGCEWFNDLIVQELVKNKHVTYLNLANTEIGSLFHESLRYLFKIRCLALGSTRINAAAIEDLCMEFQQMEKLSLYNLKGSAVFNGRCMVKKNRLNKIGDILKGLKYIDIGSLNTADDSMFDHFKNIKTIYLWMATNLSKKKIQEIYLRGINVVDDV